MGTRQGLDYSYARLPGAALAQAGISFVCRYLSHDEGKNLSLAEVHDLRASGIDVVSVWESTQFRPLEGEAAGRDDGREAVRQASVLGASPGSVIYFAVDFDVTGRSQPETDAILQYFRGVRQTIGPYSPGLNFNPDGPLGGHSPAGLNSHPEWNAGDGRANGPVVAFEPFDDGNAGLSAYVIITRDAGGAFHPYQFPSSGALATPGR